LRGTDGVGIQTETMPDRMGRNTCSSRSPPLTILTMQKTIAVNENTTWAANMAHCAL